MEILCESSPSEYQFPDRINDQLHGLSLQPRNDINGDGESSEVTENEENGEEKRDNEVENVGQIGNGKEDRETSRRSKFPVRPEAEDCSFFIRTGMCKFGMLCKFNHPLNCKTQGAKVKGKEEFVDSAPLKVKEKVNFVDKSGQIDCKYFDRPGGCKFGKACKFNHSRKASHAINFMGLPIRPGEKDCLHYMRNGSCKFGENCRFNHPDPNSIGAADTHPAYVNGGSILSVNALQSTLAPWSPPAAFNKSPPYVPLMFSPTQGVPSQPEWNGYPAPAYLPERSMDFPPAYAADRQSLEKNFYTHQQEQVLADEFPERPGQSECSYFLKTGNCKYKSACKFHHPKNAIVKSPPCPLSDLGLPLRPGESVCNYYNRYGICKYGPACKYDHPVNHAQSAPLAVSAVDQTPVLGDSLFTDHAVAASS